MEMCYLFTRADLRLRCEVAQSIACFCHPYAKLRGCGCSFISQYMGSSMYIEVLNLVPGVCVDMMMVDAIGTLQFYFGNLSAGY